MSETGFLYETWNQQEPEQRFLAPVVQPAIDGGVETFRRAIFDWGYYWDDPNNSSIEQGYTRIEHHLQQAGYPEDVAPLIAERALNAQASQMGRLGAMAISMR
jgi:hypothetical protein